MKIETLINVITVLVKAGHGICKYDSEIKMEEYRSPVKKILKNKEYKQVKTRYDKYHK